MRTTLTMLLLIAAAGCGSAAGASAPNGPDAPVTGSPPASSAPGGAGSGGATLVVPTPGSGPTTVVSPVGLRAGVSGGRGWARVTWYGGIEPCSVLRPVQISRRGQTIRLVLREGSDAAPGTACAELAMKKAVRVSLGALDPGSYTVAAGTRRARLTI